jgi:anti-sigma B factor antagonist
MEFNYSYSQKENYVLISLKGSLMEKSQALPVFTLIDEWLESGEKKFVLNLEELHYMNSSGLGVLINFLTKTRNKNGEIIICNVTEKIKDLLVITKLHQVFNVVNSIEDAEASIEKSISQNE